MKEQSHRQGSRLTILTIIFAWLPASLLVLLAAINIYIATVAMFTAPNSQLIAIYWLSIAAFAGYAGLCSVCFGFKMPPIRRLLCLITGVLAIIAPLRLMYYQSPALCTFDDTISTLIFLTFAVGTVFFALIHIVLHVVLIKKLLSSLAG